MAQSLITSAALTERSAIGRTADDLTAAQVAGRLGFSLRWLQGQLTEDARRPDDQQRFQLHHYLGGGRRWSEDEYQALRLALIGAAAEKRGLRRASRSSIETATGTFTGLSASKDAHAALERVLAYRPAPRTGTPPTRSGASVKTK